jgi:hypothetical protein
LEFSTKFQAIDPSDMHLISEIFIPNFHYGVFKESLQIYISDGSYFYCSEKQTLFFKYDPRWMGHIEGDKIIHRLRVHVPELVPSRFESVQWDVVSLVVVSIAVFLGLYFALF